MKPAGTPATRFTACLLISCLTLTPMLTQAQNNKSENSRATKAPNSGLIRV